MEGKDNRSKEKRSKMRQNNRRAKNINSNSGLGVIDVADSSDDRSTRRSGWISSTIPAQDRRYLLDDSDLPYCEEESGQMSAGDFDEMSQLPTSFGCSFQFSSEKNWEASDVLCDNTEASGYFTLNLKLLNVGLQTIPFYKRLDYSSGMFTGEELLNMNKAAENADKLYQNVLHDHQTNPRIKITSGSSRKNYSASKPKNHQKVTNHDDSKDNDELDELLNLANAKMEIAEKNIEEISPKRKTNEKENISVPPNKEDIQQWLDNVLNE